MFHRGVEGVEAELGLELGVFQAPCLSGAEVFAVRVRRLAEKVLLLRVFSVQQSRRKYGSKAARVHQVWR